MIYSITPHTVTADRTSWWKNEDRKETFTVWWVEGGGLSRPATDVERDAGQRIQELEAELQGLKLEKAAIRK